MGKSEIRASDDGSAMGVRIVHICRYPGLDCELHPP